MIFVSTLLSGLGSIYPSASNILGAASYMPGLGTLSLTLSEKGEALLSGNGAIYAEGFKELYGQTLLEGLGSIYPNASKYEVSALTFTGTFSAGETIVIDMDKFTVKHNGANALNEMTGDFFNLLDGETEIIYTDTSSTRTIGITFVYRDRWV
jgi:hypothetical protein